MIDDIVTLIELYVKSFEWIYRFVNRRMRRLKIDPVDLEFRTATESSYEMTLERIELTKQHLSETIDSIDDLKAEIVEKKRELDNVLEALSETQQEKEKAEDEYKVSRSLRNEEAERIRSLLGIVESKQSRTGKVAGFVGGIVASLIAAGIVIAIQYII